MPHHSTENQQPPGSVQQNQMNESKLQDSLQSWYSRNRSLVLRQTPVWAQSLAGILISAGSLALIAASVFRIDEVITVTGQLESIQGNQMLRSPVGGKVAEVLFTDGQPVKKGQVLVIFDTRQAFSQKQTLVKLIDIEEKELNSRMRIYEQRYTVLEKKLNTTKKIVAELSRLVDSGGFQRVQYLQQLDSLFELESNLSNLELEKRLSFLDSEKSIRNMKNQLKQAEVQLQYQRIESPASGIVFDPKVSPGSVVGQGETLLQIVPQRGLKARVLVPNKDIGFVKEGLDAQVRIDAFPFTRYGEIDSKVVQIGATALEPDPNAQFYRFPVILKLQDDYLVNDGTKIPLRSGMSVTANLKLRDKRVISILSDLLVDQADSVRSIRQQ